MVLEFEALTKDVLLDTCVGIGPRVEDASDMTYLGKDIYFQSFVTSTDNVKTFSVRRMHPDCSSKPLKREISKIHGSLEQLALFVLGALLRICGKKYFLKLRR